MMTAYTGVPVGSDRRLIVVAVVAPPVIVEHDVRIGGVHDAIAANLVATDSQLLTHSCF
jgi:hypothetical protein